MHLPIEVPLQVLEVRTSCVLALPHDVIPAQQPEWLDIRRSDMSPILLTEDWPVKFGFEKKEPYVKYGNGQDWQPEYPRTQIRDYVKDGIFVRFETAFWRNDLGEIVSGDDSVIIHTCEWYEGCREPMWCYELKYVHQFQNAIFVLSGEELSFKREERVHPYEEHSARFSKAIDDIAMNVLNKNTANSTLK